jgi:cytochrome P450
MPPGPPLPAVVQTALFLAQPFAFMTACRRRYGDVFTFTTVLFGREVMVSSPELVKQIFTSDPDAVRAGEANAPLEPLLGRHSVLLLDGQEHLRQRRLMMPPFHGERMRAYAQTMREVAAQVAADFPEGRPFALHPYMQRLTLEIILRTVFGVEDGSRAEALRDALTRVLDWVGSPVRVVGLTPAFRRPFLGLTPWEGFLRDKRAADALMMAQIARRRAEPEAGADVLGMLISARDEEGRPLRDEELHDELMTLLLAGHETTASMLCWAFDQILDAPHVAAKLVAEVEAAGPDLGGRLDYLDATIKEVLRIRPVIPAVGRRLAAPLTLGRYTLPTGMVVVPNAYLTQHDPALFPEPESFRPERFLDAKPDPYAWYPFGGGARRCLGMAFALHEMKMVLATLLRRVRLEKARPGPARPTVRGISCAPADGTEVVLKARIDAAQARAEAA